MSANNDSVKAQLRALTGHIGDTKARVKELQAQLVCECCEGKEDVAVRPIMCRDPICSHCFYIWYECGLTDPVKVREESLKRQAAGKSGDQR